MNINQPYREADLLLLAKTARIKSGATRLRPPRPGLFDAERNPRLSLFQLRKPRRTDLRSNHAVTLSFVMGSAK
jgi:hypothetical protein